MTNIESEDKRYHNAIKTNEMHERAGLPKGHSLYIDLVEAKKRWDAAMAGNLTRYLRGDFD